MVRPRPSVAESGIDLTKPRAERKGWVVPCVLLPWEVPRSSRETISTEALRGGAGKLAPAPISGSKQTLSKGSSAPWAVEMLETNGLGATARSQMFPLVAGCGPSR